MTTEAQRRAAKKYRDSEKGKASDIARHKRYYESGKGKYGLKYRRYGITAEEYRVMYDAQEGKCYICGTYYPVLHVDHSHDTGLVRALLCRQCNVAIGMAKEDTRILYNMIDYINKNK